MYTPAVRSSTINLRSTVSVDIQKDATIHSLFYL